VDFYSGGISVGLPSQGFCFELLLAANTAVQALAGEGREFGFGPVEPGAVFGCIMEFHFLAPRTGGVQGAVFVKSAVAVGALIVLHELNCGRVGVVGLHEPVPKLCVVGLGFGGRDLPVPLAGVEVISQ